MKRSPSLKFICLGILLIGIAFWWQMQGRKSATQLVHTLDTEGVPIAFLPDSRTFAVGFKDAVEFWNVRTGKLERTVKLSRRSAGVEIFSTDRNNWGGSGVFSPDQKTLASPQEYVGKGKGKPNTVILFNMKSGAVIRTLTGSGNAPVGGGLISTLAFSPDGKILAGASSDYTTRLWDVKTGKLLRTLRGHNAGVWVLAFTRDGKTLATVSASTGPEPIRLWEVKTGKLKKTLKESVGPTGLAFLSDNKTLFSMRHDGGLNRWNIATGRSKMVFQGESFLNNPTHFTPDGKFCATGTWAAGLTHQSSGEAEVRETKTGRLVCKVTKGIGTVNSVLLSSDGKLLAIYGTEYKTGNDKLKIWRTR